MSVAALWAGATTLASPVLRMLLRVRARRGKEIGGRLGERRGLSEHVRPAGPLVWIHAASVGETASVLPVLAALSEQARSTTMLLTTGTVTSARLLALRLSEFGLDERVIHQFAPLDVPAWICRFLDHWRPGVAGFVESELWPNLVAECQRRSIPLMLINARLSPHSFRRWKMLGGAAASLLDCFTRIEAQSAADADRLRALGAVSVAVPGNLKFAAAPLPADAAELERLRQRVGTRPVWLAASTHPGEEALVFAAHRMLAETHPGLLTIVAPRHPNRGPAVLAEAGTLASARRGVGEDPPEVEGIWIADTLGELGLLYRLARIAFIGRSLLPPGGGQNPLEAARLGCAIAMGPLTGNFAEIVGTLAEHGALAQVGDGAALGAWVGRMFADPAARDAAGRAGIASAARYADLPGRTAATLLRLLATSVDTVRG